MRLFIAIAACLIAPIAGAAEWNLDGKWQVVSANPALPEARGHKGTIRITAYELQGAPATDEGVQDGQYDIGISGACNGMGGGMVIAAGRPDFHSLRKTLQVCPDERGAFDKAFHGAVTGADRFILDGSQLILESAKARLVLELVD
jgi:hypothetical protein